jgi:predicted amino acid dehydrogenase
VVEGIEKACIQKGMHLDQTRLLVAGSTGDIGSACVRYFSGKVKKILLCARREKQLKIQSGELRRMGQDADYATDINAFLPATDLLIAVASSLLTDADPNLLSNQAIICDAGYPKNLNQNFKLICPDRVFEGGMGVITQKFHFNPVIWESIYRFPVPYTVHGCVLESIVLALEGIKQPYSVGRGNITVEAMRKISQRAKKHGILLTPLFHQDAMQPEPAGIF